MRAFTRKTFEAIARGNHLSNVELSHLLQRIAADPLDRISRLAVLGAHVVSPRVRGDQILWFIDNEPFTSLGMYAVNLDGEAQYRRAAELWQRAVQRWDNDLRVLENAAWFFASVEPPRAVELVESGVECSPHDADAWELAAIVFDFVAAVDSKNAKGWWERSIESAFRSFAEDPEPERRMELLLSMREAVSRVERHEVLELLDLASAAFLGAQDLSIAPRSQSLLSAVGFIALADGKNARALRCLHDALRISAVCESVVVLAESLAQRGFRTEVCAELNLAQDALSKDAAFLRQRQTRIENP